MMTMTSLACVLVMVATVCPAGVSGISRVSVRGAQLYVEDQPFFVKGVSYSPVPIGSSAVWDPPFGDYFTEQYLPIWQRDFPAIKEMNANVVRIYGWNNSANHSLFFDTLNEYGLKAIVTFYLGTAFDHPVDTPANRDALVNAFASEVQKYLGHPAILAWTFGNEFNNAWQNFLGELSQSFNCSWNVDSFPLGCWDSTLSFGSCPKSIECVYGKLFGLLNNASIAAHKLMDPDNYHLILSSLADVDQMVKRLQDHGHYAPDIDAWGLQVYRGRNFGDGAGNVLTSFSSINEKPYLITEFGVDAYNDPCGHCVPFDCPTPCYNNETNAPSGFGEDQENHRDWNIALAEELITYRSSGSNGGCMMSWVDEYWKTGVRGIIWGCTPIHGKKNFSEQHCDWKGHVDCPSEDITRHALCGYWMGSSFDFYVNEAWFGINAVQKSSTTGAVDVLVPRKLYYSLQELWSSIPDTFTVKQLHRDVEERNYASIQ